MRTPKSVRRADSKKNRIVNSNEISKVFGEITILASQTEYGDGEIARTISVFKTGSQRLPFMEGYEEDIESYNFDTAEEANHKFVELINKYRA